MKHKKHNVWVLVILILIVIGIVSLEIYASQNSFILNDPTSKNSSDQPTKTSDSNGYLEQKGEEAAVGSI